MFRKKKRQDLPSQNPYELHRSLPTPMFENGPRRGRGVRFEQPEPPKRKRTVRKRLVSFLLVILIAVAAYGGWIGWKFVDDTAHIFGWKGLFSLFLPGHLKGEDTGRVNILLAGNSADDPGHSGANLTDSIMLVSINTRDNTAYTLSIPRDLYVNIPGTGYAKVNEVYQDGQEQHFSEPGYPAGGMGFLEKTVSEKLNITIGYYALIDYAALKDAVDAVGGVTVNIQSGDSRGLYDPSIDWKTNGPLVSLTNGTHTLTGEQALDLARARGDAYGSYGFPRADFDRTQNQRMMLLALKDKGTSFGVLANPIRFGKLLDSLGKNVHTDMSLGNSRRLYNLFKKIPNDKVQSVGLNSATISGQKNVDLLQSYATPTGQSALVPAAGIDDYSQINSYIEQLNSN